MLLCLVVSAMTGCLAEEPRDVGRVGVALTAPAADATEIRSLGLFAISTVSPDFECASFLENAVDPIAQSPEALVAVEYVDISAGSSEVPFSFHGIPIGDRSIIVEAYDGGGGRLFMGCEQVLIEKGRTTTVSITMVEDPLQ